MPAKGMIGIGDYIMYWQNMTDNSLWDLTWQMNRHSTKQAHMQGGLWNHYTDPIEGEKHYKLIHKTKTKYKDQKSFKEMIQNAYFTHIVGPIGLYKAWKFYAYDSLGNTHPLKVVRNLQWMSPHPTNPTYNPVLSGTMTHSSALCLNSTTRTHNTNTYTQKVCIRYLTYCMPPLW